MGHKKGQKHDTVDYSVLTEIQCPPLATWLGLQPNSSGRAVGMSVSVSCDVGFQLLSSKEEIITIICQADGTWSRHVECEGTYFL